VTQAFFTDQMPFPSPNQHCQITEGNSKHSPQTGKITRWQLGLLVAHWSWSTKLLYAGPS